MIVQEEIYLAPPIAAVDASLRTYLLDGALDGIANAAVAEGQAAAIGPGQPPLVRKVAVQVMPSSRSGPARTLYSMRWIATGPTGEVCQTLEANLELDSWENTSTRLLLTGSYVPPFGSVGALLDRIALHHAGSATLRSFLSSIARLATSDAGGTAGRRSGALQPDPASG